MSQMPPQNAAHPGCAQFRTTVMHLPMGTCLGLSNEQMATYNVPALAWQEFLNELQLENLINLDDSGNIYVSFTDVDRAVDQTADALIVSDHSAADVRILMESSLISAISIICANGPGDWAERLHFARDKIMQHLNQNSSHVEWIATGQFLAISIGLACGNPVIEAQIKVGVELGDRQIAKSVCAQELGRDLARLRLALVDELLRQNEQMSHGIRRDICALATKSELGDSFCLQI